MDSDVWQNRIVIFAYIDEKEVIIVGRLVINGDEIYELDEECLKEKRKKESAADNWPKAGAEEPKQQKHW